MPDTTGVLSELKPRIVVVGVGGAGGNAVNNMIDAKLQGVEFVVANTDAQALSRSKADNRLQLGAKTTQGLGAGARPEVGRQAAEDSLEEIRAAMNGAHMVFITAGMGGGTGTGAAPIIAQTAREAGALAVAVVTKPFEFEGVKRMRVAEAGVEDLKEFVDTLIAIPNQNLFRMATEKTTFSEAFALADEVLHSGVRGVTDLMTRPGLVNLDFADVKTVMGEMGGAMMGTGEASGEARAKNAAELAVANPLLDDVTLQGARAVLINITGGADMTLYEVDEAANAIRDQIDPDANIIVGSSLDDDMSGKLRVSVLATGIDAGRGPRRTPRPAAEAAAEPVAEVAPEPEPVEEPVPLEPADEPAASEAPETDDGRSPIDAAREELAENPTVQRLQEEPEEFPSVPDEFRVEPDDPEAQSEPDSRRSGFGLFGRRRKPPQSEDEAKPEAKPAEEPASDFSDDFDDEELEIPAFLRRNAR